jgi:hypothetical protein
MQRALADLNSELKRLEGVAARTKPADLVDRTQHGDSSGMATAHLSSNATPELADVGNEGRTDAEVMAHAYETFGSPEKTSHWLHRPNHVFQGRTPLEVIGSDPQAVEIELTRIDHGVYI